MATKTDHGKKPFTHQEYLERKQHEVQFGKHLAHLTFEEFDDLTVKYRPCKKCLKAYRGSAEGLAEREKMRNGDPNARWGNGKWPHEVCFVGPKGLCPKCAGLAPEVIAANLQNQRRPDWADPRALSLVYRKAREIEKATGVPQDVEHVIPLQGKLVSGLHVAGNLRIVPKGQAKPENAEFTPGSVEEIFGSK